jgi:hypothetical protein
MTNEYVANRYGKNPAKARNQRILWTIVATALTVAFFTWSIAVNFSTPANLTAKIQDFTVVSKLQTQVTIKVTNPKSQDGVCAINVLDVGYAVVGYKEIAIDGKLGDSPSVPTTINTNNLAVSATVDKCWFK